MFNPTQTQAPGRCEGLTHPDGYCDGCGNTPCKDENARMEAFEEQRAFYQPAPSEKMAVTDKLVFHVGDVVDIGIAPDLLPGTSRVTERYVIFEIEGKYANVMKEATIAGKYDPEMKKHWGYMGRGFTKAEVSHG